MITAVTRPGYGSESEQCVWSFCESRVFVCVHVYVCVCIVWGLVRGLNTAAHMATMEQHKLIKL